MGYSKFLRTVFEGNPELADQQLGWEEMLDQSHYTIGHNIHPAQDQEPGTGDGTSAPPDYAGAMMPGAAGAGPPGAMPPGGMPPPDDQLQQIQPGMQQPPPAMQESEMKDDFDVFLDALLDENVEELPRNSLTEGPYDYYPGPAAGPTAHQPSNYGPGYAGYAGGYGNAPAASYYRTPTGNPDMSANALNRQELERITGDYPGSRPGGYPAGGGYGPPGGGDYDESPARGGRGGGGSGGRRGGGRAAGGGPSGANSSDFVHSPDYVRTLQQNLTAAGFDVGRTGVDGIMGKNTRAAMKQAQDKGLDFSPGGGLMTRVSNFGANAIPRGNGAAPDNGGDFTGAGIAGAGAAAARMGARPPAAAPAGAGPGGPGGPGAAAPAAAGGARALPNPYAPGAGTQPGINTAKPIQNPYLNMPNGRPTPGGGAPATPRPAPGLNMPTPGIKDPYLNMPNPPRGGPTPTPAPEQPGFVGRAWQGAKNLFGDTSGKAGLPGATNAATDGASALSRAGDVAKTGLRWGGRAATPIAGVMSAYDEYQKSGDLAKAGVRGASTGLGAAGGAAAGAALGALGGPAAPVTVPVGAAIGGVVGATGADRGASWLYDKVKGPATDPNWNNQQKASFGSYDQYIPPPAAQTAEPAKPPAAPAQNPGGAKPASPAASQPAAPSSGAPVSVSTDKTQQNQSKNWGMNWADYNLLYESDRATAKRVRGY